MAAFRSVMRLRSLHTASALRQAAPVAPAVPTVQIKPVRRVGALRGGFTGFLFGVTLTGAAAYYYLFDEYQAGQRAIIADVLALRESLQELRTTVADAKTAQGEKGKQ